MAELSSITRINCLLLGAFLFGTGFTLLSFPESDAGIQNPLYSSIESSFGVSQPPKEPMSPSHLQTVAIAGILMMGLGLAYFLTVANNIIGYVYLTVPVRIFMGIIGAISWFVIPDRRGIGLIVLMTLDVIPAALLGWHLGSLTGVVPASVRDKRVAKRD